MKTLKTALFALFMLSTPFLVTACEQESSLEEGVEEVGDEIDDATTY